MDAKRSEMFVHRGTIRFMEGLKLERSHWPCLIMAARRRKRWENGTFAFAGSYQKITMSKYVRQRFWEWQVWNQIFLREKSHIVTIVVHQTAGFGFWNLPMMLRFGACGRLQRLTTTLISERAFGLLREYRDRVHARALVRKNTTK